MIWYEVHEGSPKTNYKTKHLLVVFPRFSFSSGREDRERCLSETYRWFHDSNWHAVLCKSSGSGRLSGTSRCFWTWLAKSLHQHLLSQLWNLARNPRCLEKNFVRWMWFLFCQIKQKIGKENPKFKISIGIESSLLLCNFQTSILRFRFFLVLLCCVFTYLYCICFY